MGTYKITYFDLVVFGAILGYILGFIPLIFGIVRQKIRLGIFGLVLTILAGSLASFILALPMVAIFVWLITRKVKTTPAAEPGDLPGDTNNS